MNRIDELISWVEGEIKNCERIRDSCIKDKNICSTAVPEKEISYWKGRIDALESVLSHYHKMN